MTDARIKARLEALRAALNAENISYDEMHELQVLGEQGHIDESDVQLLNAAGVPEHPTTFSFYQNNGSITLSVKARLEVWARQEIATQTTQAFADSLVLGDDDDDDDDAEGDSIPA